MDISEITDKMVRGESASDKEIAVLLTAEGDDRETIFAAAREVRDRVFGKKTYLSGFMYFSTYCRNDCTFCYFRKSNSIDRYRKSTEEVVHLAQMIADAGINIVDLTMGEDPMLINNNYPRSGRIHYAEGACAAAGIILRFPWKEDETSFNPEQAIRQLLKRFALRYVIFTEGSRGSRITAAGGETSYMETPRVKVADTVGAGDAFTAAFTVAYLRGDSLADAQKLAGEVTAYVCSHKGAMPE